MAAKKPGKLVLARKTFKVRKGTRAKLAKLSKRETKALLKQRSIAPVTKVLELERAGNAGSNARKVKRTTTRFKLHK